MLLKKCMLFLGLTLAMAGLAMGQGVDLRVFAAGARTITWIGNTSGQDGTGLRIAFDEPV